jgi:hypothetical protein
LPHCSHGLCKKCYFYAYRDAKKDLKDTGKNGNLTGRPKRTKKAQGAAS